MSSEGTPAAGGNQEDPNKGGGGDKAAPKYDVAAVYGTLSDENKDYATRRGYIKTDGTYADPNTWLDGHRNAEKLMGGEKLGVPRLDDDTAFNAWEGWDKLGVPKDGKDYKFQRPEMPKGPDGQPIPYDEAGEAFLRGVLIKGKVGQKQAAAIYQEYAASRIADATAQVNGVTAEKTRIETALRKDLGAGYDASMASARAGLKFMAEKSGMDAGKISDLASHEFGSEETARLFLTIGKMLGEDTLQGGKELGFASGPAAARAELERLNLDPEFMKAYTTADHAGHKAAVERRHRLNGIANS